ncbi:carboxy terminal-processing peptidase [Paracrocinitomix mangrovi]|uniref:carboxy terminal-processing peptidase n=1 Tax=Paracrocinitomix mangrovi TaxID=2862509 RepID=UPI001C8DF950|nr:carboxy terminal-processing peptidase [Paracrocinitomix mangrovi]UKN00944.1 carboxy terminal-processing peptidase [Paracrocinitomix mangrovi]
MINKIVVYFLFLLTFSAFGQTSKVGETANAIDRLISKYHYEAKPLDDALSKWLFWEFIESIDPTGFYYLKEDIDQLKRFELEIDDQIQNKTSQFFDEAVEIYHNRLLEVEKIINGQFEKGFDFNKKEVIDVSIDTTVYLSDLSQLKDRWRKWLKSSVLEELFDGYYLSNPTTTTLDSLKMYLPEAAEEVKKHELFEISSITKHPAGYKEYLATFYLDDLAGYYDPHTSYFSDIEKEQFEAELSKDNYAFGFSLKEDGSGKILIAGLTPGGAAWMSNAINKDDQILSVRFGKEKLIDATVLTLNELMLLFNASNAETIELKLKKASGLIETVTLTKTQIYDDNDVIKSVILNGDKKIGYITLPDFYTDWDAENQGLGCANDVAKNIVKLKKESIDGLILDLRNNGGGSLKEAVDLAGIFINYGPIAVERNKYGEETTLKDMNKGAIYLGPLVILVNGLSASASEIFSATMQDYNRAIIVGSQTYGKSTGQVIMPLDPTFSMLLDDPSSVNTEFGFLKITRSKFYRITNETHQKEGVVPDVVMRDYYELYEYREAINEMALEKDKIEKKMYYTPLAEFPLSQLQSNSKFRLDQNVFYQELCDVIDSIQNFTSYKEITPLDLASYQQNEKAITLLYDQLFSEEFTPSNDFQVQNNQFDAEIMKINEYRSELNKKYLQNVSEDMYIAEAYHILVDYINSK